MNIRAISNVWLGNIAAARRLRRRYQMERADLDGDQQLSLEEYIPFFVKMVRTRF